MLPQFPTQMRVYLLAHKSARQGEKGSPSHAKSCDCVSASGVLPKGGGVKKFRWGRGPQVPRLKPGGGVEGRKSGRGKWLQRERGKEPAALLRTAFTGLLLFCEDGQMRASAHFYDSITANGLKQYKEASSTPRPLTEKPRGEWRDIRMCQQKELKHFSKDIRAMTYACLLHDKCFP